MGKPHDKSVDDDVKPVNDSIVFVRVTRVSPASLHRKLQECVGIYSNSAGNTSCVFTITGMGY